MKEFFRYFFAKKYSQKATGVDDPFHSLYDFSATFGYQIYALVFEILILLVLIMTGIVFVKGYMSKSPQEREETKNKLMRNFIIVLIAMTLSAIIATTYQIFSWSS